MVSDNTIVFYIQLILAENKNLGQMLRDGGYAKLDQALLQSSAVNDDTDVNDDGDEASVAAATASFAVLPPYGSPLAVSSQTAARLSAKRLVRRRKCHTRTEEYLYSAILADTPPRKCSDMDHTVLPANCTVSAFPS